AARRTGDRAQRRRRLAPANPEHLPGRTRSSHHARQDARERGHRIDAAGRTIRDGHAGGRLRPRAVDPEERRRQEGRRSRSELHNMSVPSRTVLTVIRARLHGRRYRVDLGTFTGERSTRNTDPIVRTIRTDGGTYLLNLIEPRAGATPTGRRGADVHRRLQ